MKASLAFGIALLGGFLLWQGAGAVAAAAAAAGWGIFVVSAFHLLPLWLDALALRVLPGVPARGSLLARWVGESVNGLLPVAQIGGEVVKARLLALRGASPAGASAAVIAALTLQSAMQGMFALIGIALLARSASGATLLVLLAAVLALAALIALFYRAQRSGAVGGFVHRLAARLGPRYGAATADVDTALQAAYADRAAIAWSCALHFAGWVVGVGEVWLALWFMGAPVSWTDALILESLGQAVRAAGFAVPGALGVQEGGYLALGALLGVPPPVGLGLSLVKRVRELAFGLPGLAAWQLLETRALRAAAAAP